MFISIVQYVPVANFQHYILIVNSVLLIIYLIIVELFGSEGTPKYKKCLFVFYPVIFVLFIIVCYTGFGLFMK